MSLELGQLRPCSSMTLDMRPFSVVENDGFTHLVRVIEPRYQLQSRPYFSQNVLPQLYNKVKAKLVEDLSNAKLQMGGPPVQVIHHDHGALYNAKS